jgi:ribosome-binding protein aMBF1 (putative translation factor)
MRKNNKPYVSGEATIQRLLKNPQVRFFYEEEKAKSEIAMAIRAARQRNNMTQARLAEKVGTTQSVIARLESGSDKRNPTLPFLARIAVACGGDLEIGFRFKEAH